MHTAAGMELHGSVFACRCEMRVRIHEVAGRGGIDRSWGVVRAVARKGLSGSIRVETVVHELHGFAVRGFRDLEISMSGKVVGIAP